MLLCFWHMLKNRFTNSWNVGAHQSNCDKFNSDKIKTTFIQFYQAEAMFLQWTKVLLGF